MTAKVSGAVALVLALVCLAVAAGPVEVDTDTLLGRRYKLTIARHEERILGCYNQALAKNPKLAGTLTLKITVAPNGQAQAVETVEDTVDGEVDACVSDILKKATWPTADEAVYFEYRFSFAPAPAK